jgi:hypothetical protein
MANTYVDYTATAAQTDFAFSFPYLEDEHVTVEINGVATTDFTIVTTPATKVVLNSGATVGQIVRVRRKSQPDANLVDFVNGSVLTESELDRAYLHNRYLAEEIAELNDASLQIQQGSTQWDAKSLQIKNVAAPTDTTDASTKSYVDDKVNQVSSGASFPPTKWTFTGTAGANTTYSVTGAEVNGDTAYDVSIDGAVQEPTTDFTVDPDTDTLTIVPTLTGSEDIVVIQRGFGIAIATGTIGSSQIANGSITESKLATDAVTNAKIADDSIDSEHYVDGSIDTVHIADNQITSAKISSTDANFNVQSDGKVGIGTTSSATKLDVQGDYITVKANGGLANLRLGSDGSNDIYMPSGQDLQISATDNVALSAGTSLTRQIYIQGSTGNIGVGTTNPGSYKLDVVGDINASAGVYSNGVILTSDDRVKHNEEVITNALATLAQITPKKYIKTIEIYDANHNFELDADGNPVDKEVEYKIEAGVIAQEVLQVEELAFAVTPETTNEEGEVIGPHGLNYNSLFTYAVAAIKEQQTIIEDLKARVEALEA